MNRVALTIGGALVALVVVFVIVVLVVDSSQDDEIAKGIRIGRVDVGGLDVEQARERVQRELASSVPQRVTVTHRREDFVLRTDKAKVRLDVNGTVEAARRRGREDGNAFSRVLGDSEVDATIVPKIDYSRPAVEGFVERVAKHVDDPAKDADIDIHDGKLSRQPAHNGVNVKRPQLVETLVKHMTTASGAKAIAVPVKITERPDETLADLAKKYPTVVGVDRDSKQLRLYKRLRLVHKYEIAVGKSGLETAAGRYDVKEKIVNPPWHVPNSAWAGDLAGTTIAPNDPQNPLEARWIGFHDGQGIHGTSDLASLGTAASHGCIRMSVPDVEELYTQVKIGTPLFMQ